jgi:alpha-glucosidase
MRQRLIVSHFAARLAAVVLLLASADSVIAATRRIEVASPNGGVKFQLVLKDAELNWGVLLEDSPVIELSPLAMEIDGVNLSRGVAVGQVTSYAIDEQYPWRGVHSVATNKCNGAKISLQHEASGTRYTLEVRAFDDGVGWRHVLPGDGERTPDESHTWAIPAGCTVWYHGFHGHYESVHNQRRIEDVAAGEWSAPPLVIQLPDQQGHAAITEGGLVGYAGLGLEAAGSNKFVSRLGHAHPVSHPFELRFGKEEAERLAQPAAITGEIITPWRVVLIGADLDSLVNSDVIHNVSPPPDQSIFPNGTATDWLRPGRCVWKYLDGGESSLEGMREFSRLAAELGFEYNLVEGFWRRWSEAELRSLVDYSRELGVGIILWQHSGQLRTPAERQEFFDLCQRAGVAGVKIDFLDHEAKEIVDLYHVLLAEAAKRQLIVDFHGANKPAGESRTWPNEMTREAVFGLEMRRVDSRAAHGVTLPFTRYLAGHADYTAVHFGDRRGNTTAAHQIASAAVFTSPLLVYGAHPQHLLDSPAVEMIKSIPSTWDETRALPNCEIGKLAAFARRSGNNWFLAVMNGDQPQTIEVPLDFLSATNYNALVVRDVPDSDVAVEVERTLVHANDTLTIQLQAGGGFIARFRPE